MLSQQTGGWGRGLQPTHLVLHLVLAARLLPLLGLLLLLSLGGLAAALAVATAGGVSLLGADRHAQPVVGGLHFLVGVGGPTHREGRVSGGRSVRNKLLL